jgi:uncharacterized membrane protein
MNNYLLLFLWFVIGLGLRLTNLTSKPPWTDEFSTLVFSLGNSFLGIPLDTPITADILLQPLQPLLNAGPQDVLTHLFTESNHPPLYFVLVNLWMKMFPTDNGLVSLWAARSLPAILGAVTIPAIYFFTWITFHSRNAAHFAAAIMAVSPYGIFLAQEARHYSISILWVIASLSCFVLSVRHLQNNQPIPLLLILSWIVINALGIASHYFFALTLIVEAGVLVVFYLTQAIPILGRILHIPQSNQKNLENLENLPESTSVNREVKNVGQPTFKFQSWFRIFLVGVGSFIGSAVWIPVFLQNSYGDKLTDWIKGDRVGLAWISPIGQAIAAWITMISLLPIESPNLIIAIASGLLMLIFFIWVTPLLVKAFKIQLATEPIPEKITQPITQPIAEETGKQTGKQTVKQVPIKDSKFMTWLLSSLVTQAVVIFFIFTYFFGIDLTRGARYNFVYYPAVITLLGATLAVIWKHDEWKRWGINGKKAIAIILIMGFLSAVTVLFNLGYQKYYRPDLFVQLIQQTSKVPILITTTQRTHVHIGETMGVAREFKQLNSSINPLFLLAHQDQDPQASTLALEKALKSLPPPFDLWLVNFFAPIPQANCTPKDTKGMPGINGYDYKIYQCR